MKTRARQWLGLCIAIVFFCGPWLLVSIPGELARQRNDSLWRPQTIADAVCDGRATEEMISALLDRGEDVNQRVPGVGGALVPLIEHAAECDRVYHVRQLLSRGAKVADVDLRKVLAGEGADSDAIAHMLIDQGIDLRAQNSSTLETAASPMQDLLQVAVYTRRAWLVPIMVSQGHDLQIVDNAGQGLLTLALSSNPQNDDEQSDLVKTLKALLAADAHVNPRSKEELPPIYIAAGEVQVEPVELLLKAGADPDAPAPDSAFVDQGAPPGSRVTALSVAVALCRESTVKTLLKHAARKDLVTPNGQSLNDGACSTYGKGSPGAVSGIHKLLTG